MTVSGKPDTVSVSVGFAPIANQSARILILGSLPGQRSLREAQYYAHPQNAFWKIMAALYGAQGSYEDRCQALIDHGIALWDVLRETERPGSMDADIRLAAARANDFEDFFAGHSQIQRICFNGKKSEQLFRRLVLPTLQGCSSELIGLPSTSPAYASMPYDKKLSIWRSMVVID